MKRWLIHIGSLLAVSLSFLLLGKYGNDLPWGQHLLLIWAAMFLLQVLYVPRWPRAWLVKAALWRLKPGERVEVEGRPNQQPRAQRQEGK